MKFWGATVEAGRPFNVSSEDCPITITQVSFNSSGGGGTAVLYVTVDGKRVGLGTLSESIPHISCNLFFEKEFSLSHSLQSGSVYFVGHSSAANEQEPVAKPAVTLGKKGVLQPCSKSKTNLKRQKEIISKKETEEEEEDSCCFGSKDWANNEDTLFVKGFGPVPPRSEIKNALTTLFSSCGGVQRVHVPMECRTRVPLGFAFIDMELHEGLMKALELNGSDMGGRKLEVKMAEPTAEYSYYIDFRGCDRCPALHIPRRRRKMRGY